MIERLAAGAVSALQDVTVYTPDNAAIDYSDYCAVDVNASRARFTRPLVDGNGFEYTNPGARVRFRTDSTFVRIRLRYNDLITAPATYSGQGQVLVDGVELRTFDKAESAVPGDRSINLSFDEYATRTIEIVMPYCAAVDFEAVEIIPSATLSAPDDRPATRLVALGDSITHGFTSTGVGQSWATRLAVAKNWQLLNHGYGSRRCFAVDGTTAGNLLPDVATYLIGYNNFFDQTALATFKATYKSVITNLRAIRPTIKVYCITPTWSDDTNTLTLENYRQQIRDALSELGSSLNVLVEGEPLATNSLTHFPDGIHPNDAASAQIATALASVVSL